MTFSIAARMGDAYGVAVASKFIAVGSVVPGVRIGVGAVATQAMAKVSYREDVLDLLAGGVDAATAVARVTGADEGRPHRQLGVVAATSQATFTGEDCNAWAGGRAGGDESGRYAIQGNILTGEDVVLEMERAWLGSSGMPLPRRLLDLFDLYFGQPQDVQPLTGELAQEVSARLASLGHTDADVHAALEAWSGVENYEMLLTPAGIDGRVLEALRAATPGAT